MDVRRLVRDRLRDRNVEVVVPASARHGQLHRIRISRFHLPASVAATLHEPARGVMRVPIARMVNRAGFGYGGQSWHPYVAALEEHLARPGRAYPTTLLARFYERFRPQTVHDLLVGDVRGATPQQRGVLATWPAVDQLIDVWTATDVALARVRARIHAAGALPHSQYRGPTSEEVGAMHLHRIARFYENVRATGYRPEDFPSGYITGYFVMDRDDYRFVVGHGNHRVAALQVLGYTDVPVTLRPNHPPVVARHGLRRWTRAGGGLLEAYEAAAVLNRLLVDDSRRRAAELDLL